MLVTIRQLNGCLSAMQTSKTNLKSQVALLKLIDTMLKKGTASIGVADDMYACIVGLSKLHAAYTKVQRRNG